MRRIFWIIFILIILTVAGKLFCQELTAELATHPFDLAEAEKEINAACARNLVPVGLEVEDGRAIHILYSGITTIPFKNWFLYQLTEPEKLEETLAYIISNGWIPMDISKTDAGLYILFLKADLELEGWRITQSMSAEASLEDRHSYIQQGFSLWGISKWDNTVWQLFLKVANFYKTEVYLSSYQRRQKDITDGINADISRGLSPWALSVDTDEVTILYTE